MSRGGQSRPGDWSTPAVPPARSNTEHSTRALLPTDELLLGLLGEHAVLTTSQLVRLSALPERTVQHRLGRLERAVLIDRARPWRAVGTAPYHYWLTTFGADAIGAAAVGAEHPIRWGEDPPGIRATAMLTELWLQVRDRGGAVGLDLASWRRLPEGLDYRDPHSGTVKALPVEAELVVAHHGEKRWALIVARVEQVSPARLVAVLGRFANAFAASLAGVPSVAGRDPALLILAQTSRQQAAVLGAAAQLAGAPVTRHLDPAALGCVAIGVSEPHPEALVTDAVWRSLADPRPRRLVEVLAATPERER